MVSDWIQKLEQYRAGLFRQCWQMCICTIHLDTWFDYVKKHEFKGEMYMVRYADDFVCLFQYENEAQRFYQLLIERLREIRS